MFLEQTMNKENSSQQYYKLNKVKLPQKNLGKYDASVIIYKTL